jgi:hypothetical protein
MYAFIWGLYRNIAGFNFLGTSITQFCSPDRAGSNPGNEVSTGWARCAAGVGVDNQR